MFTNHTDAAAAAIFIFKKDVLNEGSTWVEFYVSCETVHKLLLRTAKVVCTVCSLIGVKWKKWWEKKPSRGRNYSHYHPLQRPLVAHEINTAKLSRCAVWTICGAQFKHLNRSMPHECRPDVHRCLSCLFLLSAMWVKFCTEMRPACDMVT